jgi:hypothetical protein
VLDDVERRRFLVKPAREYPLPAGVGPLDIHLDEGAGQDFALPRSGRLASAQCDDHILDPPRLARPQGDVADDPVALVEQPEHRDALRHRSHSSLPSGRLHGLGRGRPPARLTLLVLAAVAAAGAERQHDRGSQCGSHDQSGVQG